MIETKILYEVAKTCEEYVKAAESLHLANIAKAIEQRRPCQIFMEAIEQDSRIGEFQGFTATVEPFLAFRPKKGKGGFSFLQHFIFYKRDDNPKIERFRVAHELGHCALHWPLVEREDRRVSATLPKIGRFYTVRFTRKQEMEADAFACLLDVHRPKPRRQLDIKVNTRVKETVREYFERGILLSAKC